MRQIQVSVLLLMSLVLQGCMSIDIDGFPLCRSELWSESTLYLGRGLEAAGISDEAWQDFVESDVTPRFPDGFSIIEARGAWRNRTLSRTTYENTTVLVILHPNTNEDRSKIREIADAYRTAFNQEAVLWARSSACVAFVTE